MRSRPAHTDWLTQAAHLVSGFATLTAATVLGELGRARDAVGRFGLPANEALVTAELVAHHQLMPLSDESADAAQLPPDVHRSEGRALDV